MITRTIQISRKEFDIEIEITRDGTPVEAKMTCVYQEDHPIECLQSVLNSPVVMAEIRHQYEGIDWDDHGDGDPLSLKNIMIDILGVKRA